ncbi:hypothetical protein RE428_12500 [Marinobacter nanhaiticus D15-8W]|uniref:DUF1440 domain-containing protein n=1 Tax=Marinobacter nanhaiticus D15-8W TaxID=626887 RepID=N6WN08_9GAMM|nr:hypothetical protein [Marinobacter nanhaiticus]ENO12881.1 hypothetical protein J057_15825 [Marinobacter nanhaiticus D15-8W]BES70232.1 hypothetical protein RE428_12500 [Marinobacter nanhaiticus D15-8W]
MNRYLAGALGGLLATVPMTIAMGRLHKRLPREEQYPLPPREITEDVVERMPVNKPRGDTSLTQLTLAAHFAYGAAAGTLWGALAPKNQRPVAGGMAFGLAVWAASYLGWIPAAKVLRPATQHPARRNLLMLAVHCIWGASTAGWTRLLTEPRTHGFARKANRG